MSSGVFCATKPAVRLPTCFPCVVSVNITPNDFEAGTLALRPQITGVSLFPTTRVVAVAEGRRVLRITGLWDAAYSYCYGRLQRQPGNKKTYYLDWGVRITGSRHQSTSSSQRCSFLRIPFSSSPKRGEHSSTYPYTVTRNVMNFFKTNRMRRSQDHVFCWFLVPS